MVLHNSSFNCHKDLHNFARLGMFSKTYHPRKNYFHQISGCVTTTKSIISLKCVVEPKKPEEDYEVGDTIWAK